MTQPAAPRPRLDVRGAVDLSSLGRPPAAPPGGVGATISTSDGTAVVVDVSEATFSALVERSATVPVVVMLWAEGWPQCDELAPVLAKMVKDDAGRWLLARIDAQANPNIAAAFQVQTVPSVIALVKGRPVPLFQGAHPEEQLRPVIDQVLELAASNGVTGTIGGADADGAGGGADADEDEAVAEPEELPLPPLHQAAFDALERDDLDGAVSAYTQALREDPRDEMAAAGLAQVSLLQRIQGVDPVGARAAAAAGPRDVAAQLVVADLDIAGGMVEDAFGRLVDLIRVTAREGREPVRLRLIELFRVVGDTDPRVVAARRALASALY
jgi:putative thioredoxin